MDKDEASKEPKHFVVTVGEMMNSFYNRHRVDKTLMDQFMEFAKAQLKEPMFPIDGSLDYKGGDIECAGGFIFDFVEIED